MNEIMSGKTNRVTGKSGTSYIQVPGREKENSYSNLQKKGLIPPPAAQHGVVDKVKNRLKHKKVEVYTDEEGRFPGLTDYAKDKTVKSKPTKTFTGATKHTLMVPKSEFKSNNPIYKGERDYYKFNKGEKDYFAKSSLVRTGGDNVRHDPKVTHYKGQSLTPKDTKKDIKQFISQRAFGY